MEGKKSPIFERRANVSLKAKVDSLEATFINMRKSIVDDIKREIRGELLEGTQNIEEYDSEALSKENRLFTKMQAEIKEEVLNELKTEIAQNLKVELRQCLLEQNVRMFDDLKTNLYDDMKNEVLDSINDEMEHNIDKTLMKKIKLR